MLEIKNILILDKWLEAYLILVLVDIVTGLLKAYKTEGFKSRKMREGIIRTLSEIIAIFFAGILDLVMGLNILMIATKSLLVFKQCISIVENLGLLGVELPDLLKDKIQDLKPTVSDEEKEE